MCGIVGLINLNGDSVSPVVLKKITDTLVHRGPDGEGQWCEANVGFGHRRLAILDLSSAAEQPMVSKDNRYVLTYNGELYNFKELRAELRAQGYQFQSQSDTEVILNALTCWGADALLKFNGMFALGFWDRKLQTLLLARDRYGIKPLYYAKQSGSFCFASEQKAITAQPNFKRNLNKPTLFEYFTFQNILTDTTLLEDIHILPAGHFATLSLQKSSPDLKLHQYWDYHFCEQFSTSSYQEHVEELRRLFKQAVNRQLQSDVEIGSYLSGGIDSGSITSIAAQSYPNLKTFTCGFDLSSASGLELAFDERQAAEAMSAVFKTEHYEMVLKAGDMERCLPQLTLHLEDPRVGQSYPNYYAAKLASKFVKVVMSGSGGDELFGGYPWRYYRGANSTNFDSYIDGYYAYWQRLMTGSESKAVFAPISADIAGVSTKDIFKNIFTNHSNQLNKPEDYVNHSLYFEAKTFLHGLFVVEDKLSMAHGLESRVPFMDNDLVDFAMKCPVSLKLQNLKDIVRIDENIPGNKTQQYFDKTSDGKRILRDAMKQYMPSEVLNATKKGFSAPDASWFRGESINFVRRMLLSDKTKLYEFLDRDQIRLLINQHLNGEHNRRLLIWSLLNFESWIDKVLR